MTFRLSQPRIHRNRNCVVLYPRRDVGKTYHAHMHVARDLPMPSSEEELEVERDARRKLPTIRDDEMTDAEDHLFTF